MYPRNKRVIRNRESSPHIIHNTVPLSILKASGTSSVLLFHQNLFSSALFIHLHLFVCFFISLFTVSVPPGLRRRAITPSPWRISRGSTERGRHGKLFPTVSCLPSISYFFRPAKSNSSEKIFPSLYSFAWKNTVEKSHP